MASNIWVGGSNAGDCPKGDPSVLLERDGEGGLQQEWIRTQLPPVWPDWAIYCTFGQLFKAGGKNYFAHITQILELFVKIFHFSSVIIFGQLL